MLYQLTKKHINDNLQRNKCLSVFAMKSQQQSLKKSELIKKHVFYKYKIILNSVICDKEYSYADK